MTLLDGKKTASKIKENIRNQLSHSGLRPGLAVVRVGDHPASQVYVRNKRQDCAECGLYSEEHALPAETTMNRLLALVDTLNHRTDIHGILVQLPLPEHLDARAVLTAIDPGKDVDGFHPTNIGAVMLGDYTFAPCTPAGILVLLDEYGVTIEGKRCVVIGRSNIVGKPMAMLLLHRHGTVTMCHSRTKDLSAHTRQADILISAAGCRGLVTADAIKPGAVVVDVAMNVNEQGKLTGDVLFEEVAPLTTHITPVPGGVGPMTRAMLLQNCLLAAKLTAQAQSPGHSRRA